MTYLSAKQIANRYGASEVTIWRWARELEGFPKPIKLGPNCTRWLLSSIEAWEASRQEVVQ